MTAPPNCNGANTTECILLTATAMLDKVERLLQEAEKTNSSFDWDPPSFAVTFIIGAVALFFALLTIIQGLYAAGPGRLKCSQYPIGTWAALTKHQFYPSELRFRSVAYTPIISIDELLKHSWPDESNWERPDDQSDKNFEYQSNGKEHKLLPYYPKDVVEEYPATWLAILATCSLDHPKWWRSKPQSPDYLPSEFTATPAFSSVHDLVSLVALSSHRISEGQPFIEIGFDKETRLPFVRSSFNGSALFDLDFRRHPVLGLYGVVQTGRDAFNGTETRQGTLKYIPERHRLDTDHTATLLYATGYIPTKPPLINFCQIGPVRLDNEAHYTRRKYDLEACEANTVGCCASEPACWLSHHYDIYQNPVDELPLEGNFSFSCLSLFRAGQLERAVIFPWKESGLSEGLQSLLISSRFWCLGEAINTTPGSRSSYGHNAKSSLQPPSGGPIYFGQFKTQKIVLLSCLRFLRDEFTPSDGGEGTPVRRDALLREITSIDDWLEDQDRSTVACRMVALGSSAKLCRYIIRRPLYNIAHSEAEVRHDNFGRLPWLSSSIMVPSILGILDADLESLFHREIYESRIWVDPFVHGIWRSLADRLSRIQKLWEFDQDKERFTYPSEDVQYWLDDLLIYRAILAAMVLRIYTVDNSEITKNLAYRKLIPVL